MRLESEVTGYDAPSWPRGDGQAACLIRATDWARTPLGPLDAWPASRRAIVDLMLLSCFPMVSLWGRGLIQIYNDAYAALAEPSRPGAMGVPMREGWTGTWESTSAIYDRVLDGETLSLEDELVRLPRGGVLTEAYFTICYNPVPLEDGSIGGVLVTMVETTKRRQAEHILRESEERYRQISEVMPQIVWSCDGTGKVDFFNARWFSYSGLSPGGDLSASWQGAIHPADHARVLAAWRAALDEGGTFECEYRLRRSDGAYLWHMDRAVPVQDDEGRIVRWFGTFTDIHERKQAEEVLRESEERFRQFAENSTAVLWVLDIETMELEYLSPSFQQVWGAPLSMVPRDFGHWIESVHPDDRNDVVATLTRVRQKGEVTVKDYRVIRPDGTVRWVQNTGFPILDSYGKVRRVAGIAQDITQHDGSMVYVVDSDEEEQKAICLPLRGAGYQVKAFASTQAFLEMAPVLVPGCVVLGLRSNDLAELSIPKELKSRRLGLPVVVVGCARGDVAYGVRAMKAGAADFLDMPFNPGLLLDAVASALATIREIAERDQSAELSKARITALSPREREVLDGLLTGGTNKSIARELDISPRTVEAHRARIMERLGAHSLPELVQIAIGAGLRQ